MTDSSVDGFVDLPPPICHHKENCKVQKLIFYYIEKDDYQYLTGLGWTLANGAQLNNTVNTESEGIGIYLYTPSINYGQIEGLIVFQSNFSSGTCVYNAIIGVTVLLSQGYYFNWGTVDDNTASKSVFTRPVDDSFYYSFFGNTTSVQTSTSNGCSKSSPILSSLGFYLFGNLLPPPEYVNSTLLVTPYPNFNSGYLYEDVSSPPADEIYHPVNLGCAGGDSSELYSKDNMI